MKFKKPQTKSTPSMQIQEINIHRFYGNVCENVPMNCSQTEQKCSSNVKTENKLNGRVYLSSKDQTVNFNLNEEQLTKIENLVKEFVREISSNI